MANLGQNSSFASEVLNNLSLWFTAHCPENNELKSSTWIHIVREEMIHFNQIERLVANQTSIGALGW